MYKIVVVTFVKTGFCIRGSISEGLRVLKKVSSVIKRSVNIKIGTGISYI